MRKHTYKLMFKTSDKVNNTTKGTKIPVQEHIENAVKDTNKYAKSHKDLCVATIDRKETTGNTYMTVECPDDKSDVVLKLICSEELNKYEDPNYS